MSDYIDKAIEAAGTRLCHVVTEMDGRWCADHDYDVAGQLTSCWAGRDTATRAVRAAAPIIEAAVREQIAKAIEDAIPSSLAGRQRGLAFAAAVARGQA